MIAAGAIWLLALGFGLWMYFHKKAPKTTILLFLVAGAGLGGVLGSLLGNVLRALLGLLASLGGRLLGVPPGAVTFVIAGLLVAEVFVIGLWFKKAKPRRYHPWLALILSTVVIAAGLPIVQDVLRYVSETASSVTSLV